ncbi:MAG: hypothetical protein ACI9R7_002397, partial [Lysobacterales bacterium]
RAYASGMMRTSLHGCTCWRPEKIVTGARPISGLCKPKQFAMAIALQSHHRSYASLDICGACTMVQEICGKLFLKAYASGMMRTSLHGRTCWRPEKIVTGARPISGLCKPKQFAMAIALQSHHRSYNKRTIAPS